MPISDQAQPVAAVQVAAVDNPVQALSATQAPPAAFVFIGSGLSTQRQPPEAQLDLSRVEHSLLTKYAGILPLAAAPFEFWALQPNNAKQPSTAAQSDFM